MTLPSSWSSSSMQSSFGELHMIARSFTGYHGVSSQKLSGNRWRWYIMLIVPLQALFNDVPRSKDLVYAPSSFPEACLFLAQFGIHHHVNSALKDTAKGDFFFYVGEMVRWYHQLSRYFQSKSQQDTHCCCSCHVIIGYNLDVHATYDEQHIVSGELETVRCNSSYQLSLSSFSASFVGWWSVWDVWKSSCDHCVTYRFPLYLTIIPYNLSLL